MNSFKTFLKDTLSLNHLDISGMDLTPEQILSLSESISCSPVLMSVHLSNLNINFDPKFAEQVLDNFGVVHSRIMNQQDDNENRLVNNVPDIKNIMRAYNKNVTKENLEKRDLQDYKEYVFKAHQMKSVSNSVQKNQSTYARGVGRMPENIIDTFVLTRKLTFPELCFNQNMYKDKYFDALSPKQWELSDKGECFICHKHKYVCIFYDRKNTNNLIPLNRTSAKNDLKQNLNLTSIDQKTQMPIIIGTVTPHFSRKLKLMNANIFAMLSLSEREEINWAN